MKRKKRKEGKYTEWQNNQDVMLESYFYDINVTNDKIAKSVVSSSNIAFFFLKSTYPNSQGTICSTLHTRSQFLDLCQQTRQKWKLFPKKILLCKIAPIMLSQNLNKLISN